MKALSRAALLRTIEYVGINRALRYFHRRDLLVLLYHGIIERRSDNDWLRYRNTVTKDEFAKQLKFIRRYYCPVSASDVRDCVARGHHLPERAVLITFDDGYKNNIIAAAMLKDLGIPAIFHVTVSLIGTERLLWTDEVTMRILGWAERSLRLPNGGLVRMDSDMRQRRRIADSVRELCKRLSEDEREAYFYVLRSGNPSRLSPCGDEVLEFMNWQEVRGIVSQGFEVGSHTMAHPILSRLTAERLDRELRESKAIIESQTATECHCLAYPNGGSGDYDLEVIRHAAKAGYTLAFAVGDRFYSPMRESPFEIGRVCVSGHQSAREFSYTISGVRGWVRRRRQTQATQLSIEPDRNRKSAVSGVA